MRYLTLTLLMLLLAPLPLAAAEDGDEAETPWYEVEVIVFSHEAGAGVADEVWQVDPGMPELDEAIELLPPRIERLSAAQTDRLRRALPFQEILPDDFRLKQSYARLQRSPDYQPLVHVGWRQPGLEREEAVPVHIHGGMFWYLRHEEGGMRIAVEPSTPATDQEAAAATDDAELATVDYSVEGPPAPLVDGTIRIVLSRYLHAEVDLLYRNPEPESARTFRQLEDEDESDDEQDVQPKAFRLTDSRRMRSGEIHYIDHPLFGVLVFANPYEPEQGEDGDKPDSEAATEPTAPSGGGSDDGGRSGTIRR